MDLPSKVIPDMSRALMVGRARPEIQSHIQTRGMADPVERASAVLARFAGNATGNGLTGLLALAGAVLNKPELLLAALPAGLMVGSLTEEAAHYAAATMRLREERLQDFVDSVEDQSGETIEDLCDKASRDQRVLKLLAEAIESAVSAHEVDKVRLLAAAFARGAKDLAAVDEMLILVDMLKGISVPEIRLLSVLSMPGEAWSTQRKGGRDLPIWPCDKVAGWDPGLARVVFPLYQKLVVAGLADAETVKSDNLCLTVLGMTCAELLATLESSDGGESSNN